jgi:cytochrome bd-type quinol oxidase subunit 2
MIQRIQSLFLLLAVVAYALMFFYPIATITEFTQVQNEKLETDYYEIYTMGLEDPTKDSIPQLTQMANLPVLILVSALILLVVYTILRFQYRKQQMKMVKLSILLNIILIAGIFLHYPQYLTDANISVEVASGAYFPLIALVLLVIANRYILKDEKLIKSVDRLR